MEGDCKENKWRKNNRKCRKVTGEKVTVDKEGVTGEERSTCDRRKDEGKKRSESRCDKREVNHRYDDKKKRGGGKEQ